MLINFVIVLCILIIPAILIGMYIESYRHKLIAKEENEAKKDKYVIILNTDINNTNLIRTRVVEGQSGWVTDCFDRNYMLLENGKLAPSYSDDTVEWIPFYGWKGDEFSFLKEKIRTDKT